MSAHFIRKHDEYSLDLHRTKLTSKSAEKLIGFIRAENKRCDVLSTRSLDLSYNLLEDEIPSSIFEFKNIQVLNLSHNKLRHLAFTKDPTGIAAGKFRNIPWVEVTNPHDGRTAFYDNDAPTTIYCRIPNNKNDDQPISEFVIEKNNPRLYRERKNQLASQGIAEWSVNLLSAIGENSLEVIKYFNNVSGETVEEIPKALDQICRLSILIKLNLSHNLLLFLPPGIGQLPKLEVLDIRFNRLKSIPTEISHLVELKQLRMSSNHILKLPESIRACLCLEELDLSSNKLRSFPDFIMFLPNLKKLNLRANSICKLPYKAGFMTKLDEFYMHDNPLVDPPYEYVLDGKCKLLWICREKYMISIKGKAPEVYEHRSGVLNEFGQLSIEFNLQVNQTFKSALESPEKRLILINQGIKIFPETLDNLEGIHHLEMDRNDLEQPIRLNPSYSGLYSLSLSFCRLKAIPEPIDLLYNLIYFNLSNNTIASITDGLYKLPVLQHVDLAHNLIEVFDVQYPMQCVQKIILDGNKLRAFPINLHNLKCIYYLSLKRNSVECIEGEILHLRETLRILDVSKNSLSWITNRFGEMKIEMLHLNNNILTSLPKNLLVPELYKSLKSFRVDGNQLDEMPMHIEKIQEIKDLRVSNPFIFPPPHILSLGLDSVIKYCCQARKRGKIVQSLLKDNGIETSLSDYFPVPRQVLKGGASGLIPKDELRSFDKSLHMFLAGDPSIKEAFHLVDDILQIRRSSEGKVYAVVLESIVSLLHEKDVQSELCLDGFIRLDIKRPWGMNDELVDCFAFPYRILFDENVFFRGLGFYDTIIDRCNEMLDHEGINGVKINFDVVRKAFSHQNPFQKPNAVIEKTSSFSNFFEDNFFSCEGEVVVISQIIYTFPEVQRRVEEERKIFDLFLRIDRTIDAWISSKDGKSCWKIEMNHRQKMLRKDIRKLKTNLRTNLNKLRVIKQSEEKDNRSSYERSQNIINQIELDLELHRDAIFKNKEMLSSENRNAFWNKALLDLKEKYFCLAESHVISSRRDYAKAYTLRRPWDEEMLVHNIDCFEKEFIQKLESNSFTPTWENSGRISGWNSKLYKRFLSIKPLNDQQIVCALHGKGLGDKIRSLLEKII